MNKPIVFISHINEEKEFALAIKKLIEEKFIGMIDVFISSDENSINLGNEWLKKIEKALKNCIIEIILCSPCSIQRPWINFEAGAGWIRDEISVIPICHSGISPDSLPLPLNLLQGMELKDSTKIEELLKILASKLDSNIPNLNCTDFINIVTGLEEKYMFWDILNKYFLELSETMGRMRKLDSEEIFIFAIDGVHYKYPPGPASIIINYLMNNEFFEYLIRVDKSEKLDKISTFFKDNDIMSMGVVKSEIKDNISYYKYKFEKLKRFNDVFLDCKFAFNQNLRKCLNKK